MENVMANMEVIFYKFSKISVKNCYQFKEWAYLLVLSKRVCLI